MSSLAETGMLSSGAPARRHYNVTFAVLALGVFAYAVMQTFVTPVLPTLQADLHTSQSTVTWVLTANLLSASIATPIFGRIGDKVGKKKMFVWSLVALAVGSLIGALATSIGVLIVARVIQGIGGGVLPLAFGIIRDELPPQKVSSAVGLVAALVAAGGGLAIVLAGPVIEALNYHFLFWIPMVVVCFAIALTVLLVPESPIRLDGPISFIGGALLTGWLVALLIAVSEGSTWGWADGKTLGLVAVAIVIAIVWYFCESRSRAPLIDMQMMKLPAVWTTNLVAFLFGAGMYAAFAFVPGFVQSPRHTVGYGFDANVTQSGLFLLPLTVFMFVFGAISARLSARFGAKQVLVVAATISAVGYAMLAFVHDERWEIYFASAIIGIALGLGFAAMSNLIVMAVPSSQTGVATGMNANIRTIGGSIGAAVTATIVTAGVSSGGLPPESGYRNGYAVLAGIAVLSTLATIMIPVKRGDESVVEQPHAELALVAGGTLAGSESE
ncbi:MAG TPA: MFS transporter [Frankiaceae bacterium]|jgi:EmrB/QacA subfamily drug resistance transporter|nr:MFS transporter [Frankiaceae bacterium]